MVGKTHQLNSMILDNNKLIILLSLVVIASYLFNILSKWIKIPSVLLLISVGVLLQYMAKKFEVQFAIPHSTIDLMGTFGLILIVLEASLDLKLKREEIPNVRNAFFAALVILTISSFLMAFVIQWWLGTTLKKSLITAIPLAVTSSAIAIPSVSFLSKKIREFIIYEATFSDIIGILFFNYVIQERLLNIITIKNFALNVIIIVIVSLVGSFILLYLINRIAGHVKFFLILGILLLIYSVGKIFHLPSLLLILVFGIMIGNTDKIIKGNALRYLNPEKLKLDLVPFKHITEETAFVIRTFFFVLFGYNVDLSELTKPEIIFSGLTIVAISLIIRYVYLRFTVKEADRMVKLFLAPRGLITVILFYSIPAQYIILEFSIGIIFFVIIVTGLMMTISLWLGNNKNENEVLLDNENAI